MRPDIEMLPIGSMKTPARQARVHSKKQLAKLGVSLKTYGFVAPVLIDGQNEIIVGVGRVEAARAIGMTEAPVVRITHLSDPQIRAYRLADNRLAEDGRWDALVLAEELLVLSNEPIELITTGFELAEIDSFIAEAEQSQLKGKDDASDDVPDVQAEAVTGPGDIWTMDDDRHRLVCGDTLDPEAFTHLMRGEVADMGFTDSPYNCPIDGFVSGSGRHREFAMASGEMSQDEFQAFLTKAHANLAANLKNGAILYSAMDWRGFSTLEAAAQEAGFELKNVCVWDKGVGGMGTFYRSQHEMILALKIGSAPHTNTFGLGDTGRFRTNVWAYRGVSGFSKDRLAELKMHPTVKPVAMIKDAILDVSRRNDIVIDGFGGSGSTLIAAHKAGRRSRLIEIDPLYCDTICRRWIALTGRQPVRQDGVTFEVIEAGLQQGEAE